MRISIFILTVLLSFANLIANTSEEDDRKEIVIIKDNNPRPRTPDFGVPIEAYYQGGVIYLHFSEDIGCMDVNVTNITTGEQWNDTACADNSVEVIAVSESHGNYQITLESETGTTYFGEFSL
ncbi:MAG: DUF3244 domain-containing protein [Muribaculaceae bacterium]|nr:DUF3244 domain-containing protein [Muribaculaceae bacterium]